MVTIFCDYCYRCSFSHAYYPIPPHMQQELVTSRIIPEFAEEVAEGGEMVSQEAGRNVGEKGEKERVFMLITLMVISLYSSA